MTAVTDMAMTPREIVEELDKYIVGQAEAKRSVAIAMRNRWRRQQIPDPILRNEIMPKNILMIGPTGVGKTEIARRLARLAGAPFIKVEATKFTEIGYVGGNVDSIPRDLVDIAMKEEREREMKKVHHLAEEAAVERVLNALLPRARGDTFTEATEHTENATRKKFREQILSGELNDKEIEIEVAGGSIGVEIMAPPGMEEMSSQLQGLFQNLGSDRMKTRKMKVKKALKLIQEEEANARVNEEEIKVRAIENVEQNGIVFIDELDKVCRRGEQVGGDVSREGVQRDLLPLIEGCTITTRYGAVKTDHILFICSGAFHVARPSDLIAELQGRLPIRVELASLTANDFERILTEPSASLTQQYSALMETEGLTLKFEKAGLKRLAEVAWQVNERTENIGARRLYTVMERLLESLSFEATDRSGESHVIDEAYVNKHLGKLVENEDLARYIL